MNPDPNLHEIEALTGINLEPATNGEAPSLILPSSLAHPAIADLEALDRATGVKLTLEDIRTNPKVELLVKMADKHLEALGYTEHGIRHSSVVSTRGYKLMEALGYSPRVCQLTAIAGYTHDVGNIVNRHYHGITSAMMMYDILNALQMPLEEIALVMGAVGNHEEQYGSPLHPVAAGLVLADKSDVHYTRVRHRNLRTDDIHDRVNLACKRSYLTSTREPRVITLELDIDPTISPIIEYFRIFAVRMDMCYRAAQVLEAKFQLLINGQHFYDVPPLAPPRAADSLPGTAPEGY